MMQHVFMFPSKHWLVGPQTKKRKVCIVWLIVDTACSISESRHENFHSRLSTQAFAAIDRAMSEGNSS